MTLKKKKMNNFDIIQAQTFAQRDRFKRISQRDIVPGVIKRRQQVAQEKEITAIVVPQGGVGDF